MAEEDASYKQLFSHERMVADLIRGFVHEAWALIVGPEIE